MIALIIFVGGFLITFFAVMIYDTKKAPKEFHDICSKVDDELNKEGK